MILDVSPQTTTILAWSYKGIAGATTLVLLTTLDDVVWLVPFLVETDRPDGRSSSLSLRILHGTTFVLTLVTLALSLCLVTWLGMRIVAVWSLSTATSEVDSQISPLESSLELRERPFVGSWQHALSTSDGRKKGREGNDNSNNTCSKPWRTTTFHERDERIIPAFHQWQNQKTTRKEIVVFRLPNQC